MEYALAVIVFVALVALVVLRPLVAGNQDQAATQARRADLEAAKESKYREIRDAELDLGMGKLSRADHRAIDSELRAEAIEILRELDGLDGLSAEAAAGRDHARRAHGDESAG